MNSGIFKGLFDTQLTSVIAPSDFLLCIGCALLCGIIITACFIFRARYTKSFAAALSLLPAVVAVVIMMVNGNVGAGVAVAGAFSLVRFRSAPGTAREIGAIFLAMGTGLVAGMGYIGYAILVSVILGLVSLIYNLIASKVSQKSLSHKSLRITIPEDLDYVGIFEPILKEYTTQYRLVQVKTTNMGSLFKLTYDIEIKDTDREKELIDKLRVRNGNLEISLSFGETAAAMEL